MTLEDIKKQEQLAYYKIIKIIRHKDNKYFKHYQSIENMIDNYYNMFYDLYYSIRIKYITSLNSKQYWIISDIMKELEFKYIELRKELKRVLK